MEKRAKLKRRWLGGVRNIILRCLLCFGKERTQIFLLFPHFQAETKKFLLLISDFALFCSRHSSTLRRRRLGVTVLYVNLRCCYFMMREITCYGK